MVQIDECRQRHEWRTELHPETGNRIQHPNRDHGNNARHHLDMSHITIGPLFTVFPTHAVAVKWMPSVVDDHFLPDMDRMTPRLPSRESSPFLSRCFSGRRFHHCTGHQPEWRKGDSGQLADRLGVLGYQQFGLPFDFALG